MLIWGQAAVGREERLTLSEYSCALTELQLDFGLVTEVGKITRGHQILTRT